MTNNKPPYNVPSMSEIAKVRGTNGYNAVSTFSGCGGSCLGFEMAGFKVLWASEFIESARVVYRDNHLDVPVDSRDIREVQPEDILAEIGLEAGEIDVLEGSPPCASFSMAGKRNKHWGEVKKYSETTQRTDDLFWEFARIVRGLQPKVFVAENVAGLVKGTAKGYFIDILRELKGCGYDVQVKVLDAQWLGVPQTRKRVIFIGVRNDLGILPSFPKPLLYRYSVRDALPWINNVESGLIRVISGNNPSPTIMTHGNRKTQSSRQIEAEIDISGYAIGRESEKLAPGESSDKYLNLVRAHPERPSPTVTQMGGNSPGVACVIHPTEKRKFTIAELKRICGFPDDFQLTGTYSQQWERLGRAVPPVMMAKIAEIIRDEVLAKLTGSS